MKNKNKKADIGITLLVIMVLVLCAVALMSFYYFEKDSVKVIKSVNDLEDAYRKFESRSFSDPLFILEKTVDKIWIKYPATP